MAVPVIRIVLCFLAIAGRPDQLLGLGLVKVGSWRRAEHLLQVIRAPAGLGIGLGIRCRRLLDGRDQRPLCVPPVSHMDLPVL